MTKKNKIKFALYARSSDKKNIKKQIDILKTLAKEKNLNIEVIIEDTISAGDSKKKEKFISLLKDVEKGKINGIITYNLNRLSRSPTYSGYLMYLIGSGKLQEIMTIDGSYKKNYDISNFITTIGLCNSIFEKIAKQTKKGLLQKVKDGDFPSRAPLGYKNNTLNRKIEIDTKTFNLIKTVFKSFIKNNSLEDILKNNKFKKLNLNKTKLIVLLSNIFYTGNFMYLNKLHKGNHEAIIDIEEHNLIKKLLK